MSLYLQLLLLNTSCALHFRYSRSPVNTINVQHQPVVKENESQFVNKSNMHKERNFNAYLKGFLLCSLVLLRLFTYFMEILYF